jgi:hypothetical protein
LLGFHEFQQAQQDTFDCLILDERFKEGPNARTNRVDWLIGWLVDI